MKQYLKDKIVMMTDTEEKRQAQGSDTFIHFAIRYKIK